MRLGKIIRIISNQYQVLSDGNIYDALAMGKLRKGESPIVGDLVEFEKLDDKYAIQKLLPRKNQLKRPLVANVDQAIIVMSAKDPEFSSVLVDRLIFLISYASIKPVLCITKMDLIATETDDIYTYIKDYRASGYEVYLSGSSFDTKEIEAILTNKISVLTGQSGAGKSSLLNRIDASLQIKTQQISKALGRGKHTTRHTQLFSINGGWIADTPGFSSLDFTNLDILKLSKCIEDFKPYIEMCKFKDCIHINEPDCAVRKAVESKSISAYRYAHYKEVVEYSKQNRR